MLLIISVYRDKDNESSGKDALPVDQQQISHCLRLPAIIDQELSDPNAINVARTTPAAIYSKKEQKKTPGKMALMGQASFFSLQRYLAVSIPALLLMFCPTQSKSSELNLLAFGDSLANFNLREWGNSQESTMVAL